MGLFGRKYPYVNFHELNLDWIIDQLKELEESTVLSVNGETGEVILYKSPNVVFPPVESTNWTLTRTAGGHEIGLQLQANQLFIRYDGATNQVYTHDSPPPYPVTSVNGMTGNVTGLYDANNQPPYPVSSVNGKTGTVMIAIPVTELSQGDAIWVASQPSPGNTAGMVRGTAAGPVSIWLDGSLDPVSGDHIAAYISWTDPNDDTNVITQKLLTNADIPSGAGVISINGLTGVVTLSANNILYNSTDTIKQKFDSDDTILDNLAVDMAPAYRSDATYSVGDKVTYQGRVYVCTTAVTTPEAFNVDHWAVSQNMTYQINQINNRLITDESHINSLQKSLGIVLNGNTTAVAVAAGQYVIVENSTITGITDGLYTAAAAWEAGFTVTAAYLTAVPNGGLNALNSKLSDKTTLFSGGLTTNAADYSFSESTNNFRWIIVYTRWYNGLNDNVAVFPSFIWYANEYYVMHRHNDYSEPFFRMNSRANTGMNAYVSDVGVYVTIYGIERIAN